MLYVFDEFVGYIATASSQPASIYYDNDTNGAFRGLDFDMLRAKHTQCEVPPPMQTLEGSSPEDTEQPFVGEFVCSDRVASGETCGRYFATLRARQ